MGGVGRQRPSRLLTQDTALPPHLLHIHPTHHSNSHISQMHCIIPHFSATLYIYVLARRGKTGQLCKSHCGFCNWKVLYLNHNYILVFWGQRYKSFHIIVARNFMGLRMKASDCKKLCNEVQMRPSSPFGRSALVTSAQFFFSPPCVHSSLLILFNTYAFQRAIFCGHILLWRFTGAIFKKYILLDHIFS